MYILENKLVASTDYYPFGIAMKERTFGNKDRYGFNGKEDDDETETQDYGMRIYNRDLVVFLSVDPLTKNYPFYSPYQFTGNNPIEFIDLDGGEQKKESVPYGKFGVMTMAVDQTAGAYTTAQYNNIIHPVKPPPPPPNKPKESFVGPLNMAPGAVQDRKNSEKQQMISKSKSQIEGTVEGGVGEFGYGSNKSLQDGVSGAPIVVIPEMLFGALGESAIALAVEGAFDEVLEGSTCINETKTFVEYSNPGSASETFNSIVKSEGGKVEDIVDKGEGVSTFTKGKETYTLRGSSKGDPTISKKVEGVSEQTKVRFAKQ